MYKIYVIQKVKGEDFKTKICIGACDTYNAAVDLCESIKSMIFNNADLVPKKFKLVVKNEIEVENSRTGMWRYVERYCIIPEEFDPTDTRDDILDNGFICQWTPKEDIGKSYLVKCLKLFAHISQDAELTKGMFVYDLDECEYVLDIIPVNNDEDITFMLVPYTDEWKKYRKANGLGE